MVEGVNRISDQGDLVYYSSCAARCVSDVEWSRHYLLLLAFFLPSSCNLLF